MYACSTVKWKKEKNGGCEEKARKKDKNITTFTYLRQSQASLHN